jgi:tRNA pseudouridine65 synthase
VTTSDADALAILHSDDALVAIAKPPGLAVHRSQLIGNDDDYFIDAARRATGRTLYLAHRLDRATSGVLLLAATKEVATTLGEQFMSRAVEKHYLAVCRGWPEESGVIDHPLDAPGKRVPKPALTRYTRLATHEWPIAMGRYPAQRYALLDVEPETGRYQQIRRHFHHVSHHLIGDTTHGRGDHNRLFRQHLGVHRLLLHAWALSFAHPVDGTRMTIVAPPDSAFRRVADAFGWTETIVAKTPFTSLV